VCVCVWYSKSIYAGSDIVKSVAHEN